MRTLLTIMLIVAVALSALSQAQTVNSCDRTPLEGHTKEIEVTHDLDDGLIRIAYGDKGQAPTGCTIRLTPDEADELVKAINATVDALGEVT